MIENPGNSFVNELYSILLIGKIILLVLIAVFLLIVFIRYITVLYHKKSSHKKYLLAYSGNLLIVAFVFIVTDLVNLHSEILEAWPILVTAIFLTILIILLIIALLSRIVAKQ